MKKYIATLILLGIAALAQAMNSHENNAFLEAIKNNDFQNCKSALKESRIINKKRSRQRAYHSSKKWSRTNC